MSDGQKCKTCGAVLSLQTGITLVMNDGDLREYYCDEHNPNKGRGYTLSDLQKWREDNQVERAKYEMSQMERVGADAYLQVTGSDIQEEMTIETTETEVRECICGREFEVRKIAPQWVICPTCLLGD